MRWRHAGGGLALLALCLAALGSPVHAQAARIVTLDGPRVSTGRFVDPTKLSENWFNEPPGTDARPNALKLDVYLPTGYRNHRDRRYPVLWLLHGHGDAYDSWPNPENGDLMRTAKGFHGIIVMPEADQGWYTDWWNGGERGDPGWESHHLRQLIPFVQHRLRIRTGRRWHAIAGLSMGGEGAMYYAEQRPGYFGSAASFSGALSIQRPEWPTGFNTQGQQYETVYGDPQGFYATGHNPMALVANLAQTRLFVSVGDGVPDPSDPDEVNNHFGQAAEIELRQHANDFVAAAEDAGEAVTYYRHQGIYAWRYWRADLRHAIDWGLFRRPPSHPRGWSYATVASVGRMWGIRFRFADPPSALETFARDGRTLSGQGSGAVTLRTHAGCRLYERLPFETRLPRRRSC